MSSSKPRKTSFNERWLLDDTFRTWLKPMPQDKFSAYCIICKTSFSLSNMGKQALKSHMGGKKHASSVKFSQFSSSLSSYFKKEHSNSEVTKNLNSVDNTPATNTNCVLPATATTTNTITYNSTAAASSSIKEGSPPYEAPETRCLQNYLSREQVTKAEIIWCMHTVMQHHSLRASEASVRLFPIMFPDSEIASKVQLHRTKVAYTITHGLAPYFHKQVLETCSKCTYFTVGFDESLNKVSQMGQMDLVVRCFNPDTNEVCTSYFDSVFLGHSTSSDLLNGFLRALQGLNLKKLLQISMDGPNVNKKFLQDMNNLLNDDPDAPILVNIGTCGLHTVHNSYKVVVKETQWDIAQFLCACLLYTSRCV